MSEGTVGERTLPPKTLKVVHITTVPESLGFLGHHVGPLTDRGFQVVVISSPGPLLSAFAARHRIEAVPVSMMRRMSPFQDIRALWSLCKVLRALSPDIVHAHTPKGGLLGVVAAALVRVPVRIYHMRGLPHVTAVGLVRYLLIGSEILTCGLAHRVVCIGRGLREVAASWGIVRRDRAVILGDGGNGIDTNQQFNPDRLSAEDMHGLRRRLGIPADGLVVGFVSRLAVDKGVEELVSAWLSVRERFAGAYLLVVGERDARHAADESLLSLLERDERVRLVGHQSSVTEFYHLMDVLAFPSYREGLPNVVLEASAMRVPVVASDIPGCRDAVLDGETGILVPVRDHRALSAAISTYLSDSVTRHRHGAAGRNFVATRFQPERISRELVDLYRATLAAECADSARWSAGVRISSGVPASEATVPTETSSRMSRR